MGFDCKINFFDARKFNHNELIENAATNCLKNLITQMNLDNVLSKSDIITIHLPLTSDTQDIIDLSALEKLKPHSVIVNKVRGGIVKK